MGVREMMAKIHFHRPLDTTVEEIAEFINDALTSWGGQKHPEDPLFGSLQLTDLTVHGKRFEVENK
jgi:hypothetical protein